MEKPLIIYALIINSLAFLTIMVDKRKALKNKWRIKESTIFTFAVLGGSLGVFLGMKAFHHKTRKAYFKLVIPFLIIINLLIYYVLLFKVF